MSIVAMLGRDIRQNNDNRDTDFEVALREDWKIFSFDDFRTLIFHVITAFLGCHKAMGD